MIEVGFIQWSLTMGEAGRFRTASLTFKYRMNDAPAGDIRGQWVEGKTNYQWDSSKGASQIEKEVQNVCRAAIGAPPLP